MVNISNTNIKINDSGKINRDPKTSLIEEISTLSEVKNSINKENKFSSEKNLSFISDSNGNNINKFLINDIHLEQNDKIIKELASELEQSTAKKDKFEQKFKNACNNIEPINLLTKKENANKELENIPEDESTKEKIINKISPVNKTFERSGEINNKKEIVNKVNVNIENNDPDNNSIINENKNINMKNQIFIQENNNTDSIKNNIINDMNNPSINSNINSNMIKNESISNLNPIKINNEIHLNEVINSNSVNKKLHAFDQKLLNLELYTKEKIIELISQINSLKQNNIKVTDKTNLESNKTISVQNITPTSNEKYKTFNNSFNSNQNQKLTQHNSFNIERMYDNISTNNENNKNIININNNPNSIFNNNSFNPLEKKRYSLRSVNSKQAFINANQRKSNFSYNSNSNNIFNKKFQSSSLTENSSNNNNINNVSNNVNINISNSCNNNNPISFNRNSDINNILKQGNNTKEIIEGTGTKIMHNLNNDINYKFLKDTEKKMENNNILKVSNIDDLYNKKSNKSINYGPSRNSFGDPSFNGAEIKLVDLNKLVNHQLPRNRLIPIHINENEYFDHVKSK